MVSKSIALLHGFIAFIMKQFKQILITAALMFCGLMVISQIKPKPLAGKPVAAKPVSRHLADFYHLTNEAGVQFYFPAGFRETRILNNEDFSFDYAIETLNRDFEIWFQVKSQKRNWRTYILSRNDPSRQTGNPDSAYIGMGQAQASSISDDQNALVRNISRDILYRYRANAGKSYLVTLPDMRETKHYKYALVLTLEKNMTGSILAICFTNEKNSEFFRNINQMSSYIRFK